MKILKFVSVAVVILLMEGCASHLSDVTSDVPTLTPQSQLLIATTSTPSETPTPTRVSSPEPSSTWTPLPTLSMHEREAKLKELLETNGGCELPCWWGITPYQTSWPETVHYLIPIASDIREGESATYYENGQKHFTTGFDFIYEIEEMSEAGKVSFEIQDDLVIAIHVFPPGTQYKYQLSQILSLLEVPKQVYIGARSGFPGPQNPSAVFVLDYSDIGIWAMYIGDASLSGENFIVCSSSVGVRLFLFDPAKEYPRGVSFVKAATMFGGVQGKKLEDATDMTPESFYDAFVDPKLGSCLETPANLWP